jgi:hypothetical protein
MHLFLIGILIGTWSPTIYRGLQTGIDDEFIPYVNKFEYFYGSKVSSSIVFVDKLEGATVGVCYKLSNHIEIDRSYWEIITTEEQEELIFHELGHCELELDHNSQRFSWGCPKSIMYPNTFSTCYKQYEEYYIKELLDKYRNK